MDHLFKQGLTAVAVGMVVAASAQASTVTKFKLFDHPDSNQTPPPYGVRLDNIFGDGKVTTFSMDTAEGVFLTVTEDAGNLTINIAGMVFGGEDTGTALDMTHAGTGKYAIDFTYGFNVAADGTGWVVNPTSVNNNGTFNAVSLVNGGNLSNFQFNLAENASGNHFKFLQDEHRLSGYPQAGQGFWVGRGWLNDGSNANHNHTQDFLFLGQMVPLPAPGLIGGVGLLGLATMRRRRA